MGQSLQVFRYRPFLPIDDRTLEKAMVAETAPQPLLYAVQYLPQDLRSEFPTLIDVCPRTSGRYEDEILWLSPDEVGSLQREFGRFQQICERNEIIPGVDGAKVKEFWLSSHEHDASSDVGSLSKILRDAALEGHWICLQL